MQCTILTIAYPGAHVYLRRAMDSIINQTYDNWIYYLIDNGSTGETEQMIKDYVAKDSRIVVLRQEHHDITKATDLFIDAIMQSPSENYLCMLDADDEYNPDFLKIMTEFIQINSLDLAACGYDTVYTLNNVPTGETNSHSPPESIIIDQDTFERYSDFFPIYFPNMRAWWAKLYSVRLLHEIDFKKIYPTVGYGRDSLCTFEIFRKAARIGILPNKLHTYFSAPRHSLYSFDIKLVEAHLLIIHSVKNFLTEKFGYVTVQNEVSIQSWYCHCLSAFITMLMSDKTAHGESLKLLHQILTFPTTIKLFGAGYINREVLKGQFRDPLMAWLLTLDDIYKPENSHMITDIQNILERGICHPERVNHLNV